MSEDQAFWVLCAAVERLRVNDCYSRLPLGMQGYRVQSAALAHIAALLFPEVAEALGGLNGLRELVAMTAAKCLLGFFVGSVPLRTLLLIIDEFLCRKTGGVVDEPLLETWLYTLRKARPEIMSSPEDAAPIFLDMLRNLKVGWLWQGMRSFSLRIEPLRYRRIFAAARQETAHSLFRRALEDQAQTLAVECRETTGFTQVQLACLNRLFWDMCSRSATPLGSDGMARKVFVEYIAYCVVGFPTGPTHLCSRSSHCSSHSSLSSSPETGVPILAATSDDIPLPVQSANDNGVSVSDNKDGNVVKDENANNSSNSTVWPTPDSLAPFYSLIFSHYAVEIFNNTHDRIIHRLQFREFLVILNVLFNGTDSLRLALLFSAIDASNRGILTVRDIQSVAPVLASLGIHRHPAISSMIHSGTDWATIHQSPEAARATRTRAALISTALSLLDENGDGLITMTDLLTNLNTPWFDSPSDHDTILKSSMSDDSCLTERKNEQMSGSSKSNENRDDDQNIKQVPNSSGDDQERKTPKSHVAVEPDHTPLRTKLKTDTLLDSELVNELLEGMKAFPQCFFTHRPSNSSSSQLSPPTTSTRNQPDFTISPDLVEISSFSLRQRTCLLLRGLALILREVRTDVVRALTLEHLILDQRTYAIYQNQRYYVIGGWSSRLLPTDRFGWSDITGKKKLSFDSPHFSLPGEGWRWIDPGFKIDYNIEDMRRCHAAQDSVDDSDFFTIGEARTELKSPIEGVPDSGVPVSSLMAPYHSPKTPESQPVSSQGTVEFQYTDAEG